MSRFTRATFLMLVLAICMAGPRAEAQGCRQALALGLDVSGSVDAEEYRLQMDGLAAALLDEEVQAAFLSTPSVPVRVMVFEWSGLTHQRMIIPWRSVLSAADLAEMSQLLRATQAVAVPDPSTAIGSAMLYGAGELLRQEGCWRRTLDISGDGPANIGRHPRDVPAEELGDVVVNGLVIGPDGPSNTSKNLHNVKSLLGYYKSFVLRGPDSFAEAALEFEDFENAMRRKLIRELQPAAVSRLTLPRPLKISP